MSTTISKTAKPEAVGGKGSRLDQRGKETKFAIEEAKARIDFYEFYEFLFSFFFYFP